MSNVRFIFGIPLLCSSLILFSNFNQHSFVKFIKFYMNKPVKKRIDFWGY